MGVTIRRPRPPPSLTTYIMWLTLIAGMCHQSYTPLIGAQVHSDNLFRIQAGMGSVNGVCGPHFWLRFSQWSLWSTLLA